MPVMDVTILLITHVFFRVVGERDVSVLTGSIVLACLLDDFKVSFNQPTSFIWRKKEKNCNYKVFHLIPLSTFYWLDTIFDRFLGYTCNVLKFEINSDFS